MVVVVMLVRKISPTSKKYFDHVNEVQGLGGFDRYRSMFRSILWVENEQRPYKRKWLRGGRGDTIG